MSTEPTLHFSKEEYAGRVAKTRAAMAQRNIELLLVTGPSNMAWLTGYDGWSFYVHQCVVLTHDGEPVWFGRRQDANGAKRTCYMHHDNIIGYPDHYVQSIERHPMDYLCSQLTRIIHEMASIARRELISQGIYFSRRILTDICKRINSLWNQGSSGMPSFS